MRDVHTLCLNIKSAFFTTAREEHETQIEQKLILHSYYMALSHADWKLQNSRIWLAKIDIDCGLDFPI